MEIRTERLVIRLIAESDYPDICAYGCDEETGRYMLHWPKDENEIRRFIAKCIEAMSAEKPNWFEFVLCLKSDEKVIGNVSIILQGDEGEIGWISNKKYWNHGYMSEALRALIPYAFANLRLRRLYATCAEKNTASIGVMEKCGLKRIRSESNLKAEKKGVEVTYNKLTYETKA